MRYACPALSRVTLILVLLLLVPFSLWWVGQSKGDVHAAEASTRWGALLEGERQAGLVEGQLIMDAFVPDVAMKVIEAV